MKHTHTHEPIKMEEGGYFWKCPECPKQMLGFCPFADKEERTAVIEYLAKQAW